MLMLFFPNPDSFNMILSVYCIYCILSVLGAEGVGVALAEWTIIAG